MKKRTVRIYSIIAFVVLPALIILFAIAAFLFLKKELTAPTIDKTEVTDKTRMGELYEVLLIEEGDDIYVIYAIDDFYRLNAENELIAFHGFDKEEIRDMIGCCDYGAYATSYWQGEGERFDFSKTGDFEAYLKERKGYTYTEGKTPDWEAVAESFSQVIVYELEDYMGYEHTYNNGITLVVVLMAGAIGGGALIALAIELLIAFILRFTVFKGKKG